MADQRMKSKFGGRLAMAAVMLAFAVWGAMSIYTGNNPGGLAANPMVVASRLSNAMTEMGSVKSAISAFYSTEGRFPRDNNEAGVRAASEFASKTVKNIRVYNKRITASIDGYSGPQKFISLEIDPDSLRGNALVWNCLTRNIDAETLVYLKGCKDISAEQASKFLQLVEQGDYDAVTNLINDVTHQTLSKALLTLLSNTKQKPLQHLQLLELVLDKGANPNASDDNGPALHQATAKQHGLETLQQLMEKGADILALDADGSTVLMRAIKEGRKHSQLNYLAQQGAVLDALDKQQQTALHQATLLDNTQGVETLLALGASPNLLNLQQQTPLETALSHNLATVVNLLTPVTHNAEQILAASNRPPLMAQSIQPSSSQAGYRQVELLKAIRANQIDTIRAELQLGADYHGIAIIESARLRQANVVRWFVEQGVNVNTQDEWGNSALTATLLAPIAIDQRAKEIVHTLLNNGALAEYTDPSGRHALHYLADAEQQYPALQKADNAANIARLLLAQPVSPDDIDGQGNSSLALAVEHGYANLVKLFLSNAAKASAYNREQKYLLDVAAQQGNADMAWQLLAAGAQTEQSELPDISLRLLYFASQSNDTIRIDELLATGVLPSSEVYFSSQDNRIESPLALAIRMKNWPLVTHFYQSGTPLPNLVWMDIDPSKTDSAQKTNKRRTPLLQYALLHGGDMQALLDQGLDPNTENEQGESTLVWAFRNQYLSAVEPLLRAGANPNVKTPAGKSALSLATDHKRQDLALLMIKKGAQPNSLTESRYLQLQAHKSNMPQLAKAIQPFVEAKDIAHLLQHRIKKDQGKTLTYWAQNCQQVSSPGFYIARSGNTHRLLVDSPAGEASLDGFNSFLQLHQDPRIEWLAGDQLTLAKSQAGGGLAKPRQFRQCTTDDTSKQMAGVWSNRRGGLNKIHLSLSNNSGGKVNSGKNFLAETFTSSPAYQGRMLTFTDQPEGEQQAWLIQGAESNIAFLHRPKQKALLLYRVRDRIADQALNNERQFSLTNLRPN